MLINHLAFFFLSKRDRKGGKLYFVWNFPVTNLTADFNFLNFLKEKSSDKGA
jgi:hypothetical protein